MMSMPAEHPHIQLVPDTSDEAEDILERVQRSVEARSNDALAETSESFTEQFRPADPAAVGCDACLPLVVAGNGTGSEVAATWIATAKVLVERERIVLISIPNKTEDSGAIFLQCTMCSMRHHGSWKLGGASTRWLVGRVPEGPVYQGRSSFQPVVPLAEDLTRHYREHNLELLRGRSE